MKNKERDNISDYCVILLRRFPQGQKLKENSGTVADWLQHVNSSLVHFATSLQILFKERQSPEQSAVILQDLYVVRDIAIHLIVLLGLQR